MPRIAQNVARNAQNVRESCVRLVAKRPAKRLRIRVLSWSSLDLSRATIRSGTVCRHLSERSE
eukprot:5576024-Prymnesium_polylepis.1